MAPTPKRYAAVSLFSGCGGMDLGAELSDRVKVVWAIDQDRWAVETYKRNLGRHIVEGDVTKTPVPNVPCDILLAGPPCQDYSTLWNHDGLITARGNLFREVARFLDHLRPAAFILENVPGLLSANRGAAWTLVRHALKSPSSFSGRGAGKKSVAGVHYDISAQLIDMADLGIAQHRERLIVIGVRRDLGIRPPVVPTPFAGAPLTVRDVLDKNPLPTGAPNHELGQDSSDVIERLKLIPPGGNFEAVPAGHRLAVKGLISHVYRRLDPDKPSYTIIAGGGGGTHGYHHVEPRRLSNREKARLQGFPDDFIFHYGTGPRDDRSAYPRVRRQIGNAVPPPAAHLIASEVANALLAAGVRPRTGGELSAARRGGPSLASVSQSKQEAVNS
ncbi:DNA cytosine methyltransferase [Mycobacterium manitobense]|uniref:Cytosine-specific methyltransferase n=1 Tax=[Mycobacterium] manitobense TaxID=190147 RepID=A0A9X3BUK5_9MYCO|nr:DNA cytosine methyltransferase [[Mycobacterium] manitobense]MCV7170808.1 DNA cytosine methyltransferase [[Mycobacterium] manitobense]